MARWIAFGASSQCGFTSINENFDIFVVSRYCRFIFPRVKNKFYIPKLPKIFLKFFFPMKEVGLTAQQAKGNKNQSNYMPLWYIVEALSEAKTTEQKTR